MYEVGVDLPPGSYKAVPHGSGYLKISRNNSHALAAILSNEVLVGERTSTLRAGQSLKVVSAHVVVK